MISIFDLFKIGIGPSSSHTVGPMKAANLFVSALSQQQLLTQVDRVQVELFGSLGATGKGHGSDIAVMLGLMGEQPQTTDVAAIPQKIADIQAQNTLCLNQQHEINFVVDKDLILNGRVSLPHHPNALTITAFTGNDIVYQNTYYSIGGGFVQTEQEAQAKEPVIESVKKPVPYPFNNAKELLQICQYHQLSIAQVVRANELANLGEDELLGGLNDIWQVMQDCVNDGCRHDGILPGGLQVQRRAKAIYQQLSAADSRKAFNDALAVMDWVNLYALAVNEENASGGRVVTAPTNGAAGVIPAVMHYYRDFCPSYTLQGLHDFLLTAAAIGIIIKENASISGAEVGCQGEVGSACAMAAAGLTYVLGGSPAQCANAAEIGIEHHLGMTCDPIAGLVQVPCIERNAMAAVKAINASRLALKGNGQHVVSLDKAIKTMKETGRDMMSKYKETAMGGLAINVLDEDVAAQSNLIPTLDVTVNYSQC
ncbi:L-serine deaminase I [Enhydrobacter sp. 8BJ]|nr:L-serine ammonia-lyase [Enhydrobacter sp. 8BJ]ONG39049.1 L-serine ammonia-lyase [Enhydrobacter sp. H5]VXB28991.1 L-serine deaminase I [Enhydrobacter sp. 8BJ]